MDDGKGIEAFRLRPGFGASGSGKNPQPGRKRVPRQLGAFIRGPIPLTWLDGVLRLRGRSSVLVALALVYQSGLECSTTVRFTQKLRVRFRVTPRSASRALDQMEAAGLVRIHRPPGRCREVEILNPSYADSNDTCGK